MSFSFNPFTGNLDETGGSSSFWSDPVADKATLDAITTDTDGSVRVILSTNDAYRWNLSGTAWQFVGKVKTAAVGSSPSANGYTVGTDNTVTLQPADATHPGVITTAAQTLAGIKTFNSAIYAPGGVDLASTGTLAIGTSSNATTINIGNAGATVNIQGTVITETTSTLNVTNPVFTLNSGGSAGSASNSGMQVNENSIITGYLKTSADRNSWIAKAPNTAGIATITPGAGGITLNQTSHNPVTLTAVGSSPNSNAASLSTQALTLQPADGTNPGVVTAGAQTIGGSKTFSAAITASNLSGTNTGDVTLVTVGSVPNANGASLSGQALTLQAADGSNPGVLTAGTQTIGGAKTFSSAITSTVSTGTAPFVIASTTRVSNLNVATSGNADTVTTNANLTGPITSVGNATSIASQTGTGTTFAMSVSPVFTTPNIGTATGSASLNVLKAGDTMTGPLVMPAGSVSATSLNGGTAGTGLTFPSSTTLAFNSTGAEVARITGNGILINTATLDATTAAHLKAPAGQTGVMSWESTGGSTYAWTLSGNSLSLGLGAWMPFTTVGSSQSIALSTTNTGPTWPIDFNTSSTNTTMSSIASGSTDYGMINIRNKSNTTNNMEGITFSGQSAKPVGQIIVTNQVQTTNSEQGKMDLRVTNAGTPATVLTLNADKSIVLPGYTTAGLLSNDGSGNITSVTNYASAGDIKETSFSAANNQAVAANVTGLAFANGTVRAASVLLSVYVDATTDLFEVFTLKLIQKAAAWTMAPESTGDTSGFVFTVTSAGQVQYTNNNYTGFTSATLKFRAITVSV